MIAENALMSLDDFARFIDAVESLLKPAPQLWHSFLNILRPFVPPPPNPHPQQEAAV